MLLPLFLHALLQPRQKMVITPTPDEVELCLSRVCCQPEGKSGYNYNQRHDDYGATCWTECQRHAGELSQRYNCYIHPPSEQPQPQPQPPPAPSPTPQGPFTLPPGYTPPPSISCPAGGGKIACLPQCRGCEGARCDGSMACDPGLICINSICQAQGSDVCRWGCKGWKCDRDSPCKSSLECTRGVCSEPCTWGCQGWKCNGDSPCQKGLECSSGVCSELCTWGCRGWKCNSDNPCQKGLTCNTGVCSEPCTWGCQGWKCSGDNPCQKGLVCTSGICSPPCTWGCQGWKCSSDSPCQKGLTCTDGSCSRPCTAGCRGWDCDSKKPCRKGLTCTKGICAAPCTSGCEGWDCDSKKPCQSGLKCTKGVCTRPCTWGCEGWDCDQSQPCQTGLNCTKGICAQPCTWGCRGWKCDASTPCQKGLSCVQGICGLPGLTSTTKAASKTKSKSSSTTTTTVKSVIPTKQSPTTTKKKPKSTTTMTTSNKPGMPTSQSKTKDTTAAGAGIPSRSETTSSSKTPVIATPPVSSVRPPVNSQPPSASDSPTPVPPVILPPPDPVADPMSPLTAVPPADVIPRPLEDTLDIVNGQVSAIESDFSSVSESQDSNDAEELSDLIDSTIGNVQTALGQLAPDSPLVDPLTALLGTLGAASAALDAAITAGLTAEALPAVAAAISDALNDNQESQDKRDKDTCNRCGFCTAKPKRHASPDTSKGGEPDLSGLLNLTASAHDRRSGHSDRELWKGMHLSKRANKRFSSICGEKWEMEYYEECHSNSGPNPPQPNPYEPWYSLIYRAPPTDCSFGWQYYKTTAKIPVTSSPGYATEHVYELRLMEEFLKQGLLREPEVKAYLKIPSGANPENYFKQGFCKKVFEPIFVPKVVYGTGPLFQFGAGGPITQTGSRPVDGLVAQMSSDTRPHELLYLDSDINTAKTSWMVHNNYKSHLASPFSFLVQLGLLYAYLNDPLVRGIFCCVSKRVHSFYERLDAAIAAVNAAPNPVVDFSWVGGLKFADSYKRWEATAFESTGFWTIQAELHYDEAKDWITKQRAQAVASNNQAYWAALANIEANLDFGYKSGTFRPAALEWQYNSDIKGPNGCVCPP